MENKIKTIGDQLPATRDVDEKPTIKNWGDLEKAIERLKDAKLENADMHEWDLGWTKGFQSGCKMALEKIGELKAFLLTQKTLEKTTGILLKGNELGWLITLAETHYFGKDFQEWMTEHKTESLFNMLQNLLNKFHPVRFNAGRSETTWELRKVGDDKSG